MMLGVGKGMILRKKLTSLELYFNLLPGPLTDMLSLQRYAKEHVQNSLKHKKYSEAES